MMAKFESDIGYAIDVAEDWQNVERIYSNDECMNPYAYKFIEPGSYNREINAFNVVGVCGRILQVIFGGHWLFAMTMFVCGTSMLVVLQMRLGLKVLGVL